MAEAVDLGRTSEPVGGSSGRTRLHAVAGHRPLQAGTIVSPRQVGALLLRPYVLAVELASMLLLAGLVGAYHLGRQESRAHEGKGRTRR